MVRGRRRSTATTEKAVTYESFAWNDLYTRDVEAAKAFYAATVGWTFEGGPMPHVNRTSWIAKAAGKPAAGILDMRGTVPDSEPPHWLSISQSTTSIDALPRWRTMAAGSSGRPSTSQISGGLLSERTPPEPSWPGSPRNAKPPPT